MDRKLSRLEELAKEQEAFDRLLPDLMRAHPGRVVLFREGKPFEFFDDVQQAYEAGLREFGLDRTFLVARVEPKRLETASIAWYAGVSFA